MPTDCAASYRSSSTPQTKMYLKHLRAVHHCRSAGWLLSFLLRHHQHLLPIPPLFMLTQFLFFNSPFGELGFQSYLPRWNRSVSTLQTARVHLELRWKSIPAGRWRCFLRIFNLHLFDFNRGAHELSGRRGACTFLLSPLLFFTVCSAAHFKLRWRHECWCDAAHSPLPPPP